MTDGQPQAPAISLQCPQSMRQYGTVGIVLMKESKVLGSNPIRDAYYLWETKGSLQFLHLGSDGPKGPFEL